MRTMVKICDIKSNFVGEVEAKTQNFLSAGLLPKQGSKFTLTLVRIKEDAFTHFRSERHICH